MDYTEIIVTVPVECLDNAEAIANMVVHYGIYIEDYSNLEQEVSDITKINLIDEELLKKDRAKALIHIYIDPLENPDEAKSYLNERMNASGISYDIQTKICLEVDWANNWKKYYHPMKIGKRLLICPAWQNTENDDNRVVFKLEPGMAFGTGAHETTRLCLTLLDKYITSGEEMLDVGCGSGILSIASLLLGAKSATAIDIDALAVATARENAKSNGVEDRLTALKGNLTDKVSGRFDIVAANIVADIILELNKSITDFLKPNGLYIMSGIIDTREDEILQSISEKFKVLEVQREKGWSAIAVKLK